MKKYWKTIAGFLAFCVLMAGSMVLYNQLKKEYEPGQNLEPGDSYEEENGQAENLAPDFEVEDAGGGSVSLSSMEGKPVVLNFWASWCPPCKSEMPDFQKAYEAYGEDIQFMMVNMTDGSRETKETAEAYIEEQGYTFPVYYDVDQEAAYGFYVSSLPATYFIDENGMVIAAGRGMLDEEALERGISYLLPE